MSLSARAAEGTSARARRTLRLTHVVAILCALTLLWLVDFSYQRLIDINAATRQATAARAAIETLTHELVLAESSQRGYMMTGDEPYLDTYRRAAQRIEAESRQLQAPIVASFGSADAVASFRALLAQRLREMSLAIRLRADGKVDAAAFATTADTGRQQMKDFLDRGAQLIAGADRLIIVREQEFEHLIKLSRLAFFACVLAVLFGFVLYVHQRHRMRAAEVRQQRALEAARDALEVQVRERTQDLAELASYLQHAVETERARLARELHDELGALMTAAKLDVARLKSRLPPDNRELNARLQHLNQMLSEAIALKRRIMDSLHPSSLGNLGLVAALEILTREFSHNAGVPVQTTLEAIEPEPDPDCALTIYRTVQEALTNIARYARARTVTVTLRRRGAQLEVVIGDDGVGFDPTRLSRKSHGLAGMRHRLLASGGQLSIESAPGRGTRVRATLPLPPAAPSTEAAAPPASELPQPG